MASTTKTPAPNSLAIDWVEEDNLMLLECWARDGYTLQDICNKIGIGMSTFKGWRKRYPEIDKALKAGREIIDYKVENALLKSALGYKAKEVKVTTIMRHGKVVETQKETLEKEQAPNVSAIQCWLYNRLPKKWKNMNSRANIFEDMDEDTSIHVTVTRATKGESNTTTTESEEDREWQEEVNSSIEIRNATEEEKRELERRRREEKKEKKENSFDSTTKVEQEASDDLDYWPDDWKDDEEWEE